jgi:hypothetical protein
MGERQSSRKLTSWNPNVSCDGESGPAGHLRAPHFGAQGLGTAALPDGLLGKPLRECEVGTIVRLRGYAASARQTSLLKVLAGLPRRSSRESASEVWRAVRDDFRNFLLGAV